MTDWVGSLVHLVVLMGAPTNKRKAFFHGKIGRVLSTNVCHRKLKYSNPESDGKRTLFQQVFTEFYLVWAARYDVL